MLVGYLAFRCGLIDRWEPVTPAELVGEFSWERVSRLDIVIDPKELLR